MMLEIKGSKFSPACKVTSQSGIGRYASLAKNPFSLVAFLPIA